MDILCPLCNQPLSQVDRTYRCCNGHSFDIARQGYVNLLPVQMKHSLMPGDTKEQVQSRREFLEGGFYLPIAETLRELAAKYGCKGPILDVGCGEGYYSSRLAQALQCELVGVDISKEAVRCAAGRYKNARWLCATASKLPVKDAGVGLLTSLFSLTLPTEFRRVLRPDGIFIQVLAGEDHLLSLKSIIYPQLTEKAKKEPACLPGFSLIESLSLQFTFTVEGSQVQNLLRMTPHVYRIADKGLQRLLQTPQLTDTASCIFNVYRPV